MKAQSILILSALSAAFAAPCADNLCARQDCQAIQGTLSDPDQPVTFRQYFYGQGVTEDQDNPGAAGYEVVTRTYDGSLSKCDAAASCVQLAGFAEYESFDLHRVVSANQWECVLYFDANRDASYFDQPSADVSEVYGFSL